MSLRRESFKSVVGKVVKERLTLAASTTFNPPARLTMHRQFEKRDGGIVNEATIGPSLVQDNDLEEALVRHIEDVQTQAPAGSAS